MREKKRFRWLERARKYIPFTWSALEQKWVDEQGPYAPEAIAYIREHQKDYDVFIFVTYLYYLTVRGLPEVADRSILIPTAHDEPFLKMRIYEKLFRAPRGYFFNTEEEKQLVYQTFGTEAIPSAVGGVGIEAPEVTKPENFQKNIIWAAISCMSEGWTAEKTASSYSGIFCGIKDKAGRISSWC